MGIVLNDRGPKKPMGGLWDIAYASLFFVWDDAKRNWQILTLDGGVLLTADS